MPSLLFEPITLRGLSIRNRLWVSPMCQYSSLRKDGVAGPWHLVHYGSFARGGAGAVIVEATGVLPEARISPTDLGLWNDAQRDSLVPVVEFIHSQGAAAGIQLAHAGRKASTWPAWGSDQRGSVPEDAGGWQTLGPSATGFPGLTEPREMSTDQIADTVAAFAAAARRSVEAGFDFVEVHAAHGYLLHAFLSPLSNTRTDAYGGSAANRARMLLETVDAVRAEVGESVPVLVRISATDWAEGGLRLEDTIQLSGWLKAQGVDLVDVSSGGSVITDIPVGPGYQVSLAAGIREQAALPTAAVGSITQPYQAEQILRTGQSDVVLMGREFLRDPHFPLRAAAELGETLPYLPPQYERALR